MFTNSLFGLEWFSLSLLDCGLGYVNTTKSISVQSSLINPALNNKNNQINFSYTPIYPGFNITELNLNAGFNIGFFHPNIHIISQQHSKMNNAYLSINHDVVNTEKMKVGVAINYSNANIKDYSNYNSLSTSVGLLLIPHNIFRIGLSYLHFYNYQFDKNELDLIDPSIIFGISLLPVEDVDLFFAIQKSQYLPWAGSFGIKLQHWDFFYYSISYEGFSEIIKGGVNFKFKNFNIQESLQWHLDLGLSHSLSLFYSF